MWSKGLKKEITVNKLASIGDILALELSKMDLNGHDECDLIFSNCKFGKPLPMLIAGREIRALTRNNPKVKFTLISRGGNFQGYADHVGFFRYCGFDRGNHLGQAEGSRNFTPITAYNLDALREASGDRPYAEIIEEKSTELTRLLLRTDSGDVFAIIQYSIREILRNCMEHSEARGAIVFGQYWPTTGEADIVIYDTGIGLQGSLLSAGLLAESNSRRAIELALEPGVSAISEAERQYQDQHYRNSGFGLYVTSTFFGNFGNFKVITGDCGLDIKKGKRNFHDWNFQGTCINLRFNANSITAGREEIRRIVQEGEQKIGGKTAASASSKSLPF